MKKFTLAPSLFAILCTLLQVACDKDETAPKPIQPPPVITSISPNRGKAGTEVTITGSNFGATPEANIVTFNGIEAVVTIADTAELLVVAPDSAGSGAVAVTVDGQTVTGPKFTYLPENRPPEEFKLLTVKDQQQDVDLNPKFTWEQAIDPDGDAITYTLYLELEDDNPANIYAKDLSATSFTPEKSLLLRRRYYWKVVAKDGLGGEISSPIFSFVTRYIHDATHVTASAAFSKRGHAAAVAFKNKIWLIGGRGDGSVRYNDIWSTTDGKTWNEEVHHAAFAPRGGHTALVFKDKMWVMGGFYSWGNEVRTLGDVWYSSDGKNWEMATDQLPGRVNHQSLVYDGKMWIIGGYSLEENRRLNDVWYSTDGANWTQAIAMAAFPPRAGFTALPFEGKMYVICGWTGSSMLKDIWVSTNGQHWDPANDFSNRLQDRAFHASVVFGGKMFMLGGSGNDDDNASKAYKFIYRWFFDLFGTEGSWGYTSATEAFSIRTRPAVAVFDNKVWVIGGKFRYMNKYYNDVWYFD